MQLTREERTGIRALLNRVPGADVIKIASACTNYVVKPESIENRQKAIQMILQQSTSLRSILNRKTVRREILFSYLNDQGVTVREPNTKQSLIEQILDYWKEHVVRVPSESSVNPTDADNISSSAVNPPSGVSLPAEDVTTTKTSTILVENGSSVTAVSTFQNAINKMTTEYVCWFYNKLNANRTVSVTDLWPDCILQLNFSTGNSETIENTFESAEAVTEALRNTLDEHGLYFNPNLAPDGTRGVTDPHGLVCIAACGTLHKGDSCVGLFQQMFYLAKDPSSLNWRLTKTMLNLMSKNVTDAPKLTDDSFAMLS